MNVSVKATGVCKNPKLLYRDIKVIPKYVVELASMWESRAKEIIADHPAVDTGRMLNSVHTVIEPDGTGFTGVIATEYAQYWEFGTNKLPELMPARRALIYTKNHAGEVLKELRSKAV